MFARSTVWESHLETLDLKLVTEPVDHGGRAASGPPMATRTPEAKGDNANDTQVAMQAHTGKTEPDSYGRRAASDPPMTA